MHAFDVHAFDADGDTIVGPRAPAFVATAGGSKAYLVSVSNPTAANPNRFTLIASASLGSNFPHAPALSTQTTVTLHGSLCAQTAGLGSLDLFLHRAPAAAKST